MFIKELEITGFKSFGEKTHVVFNSNITGVVGPNGCGKSNILDALKWVLGEKSVKSMRGDKMEDVIFSGTENKKPAGFAEVDLILDNRSKIINLDYDEIKISRKLFRDGQSIFSLNDNRTSRKEIEGLLMDTGLGKASYSFMQQGQMDMILSSKPEDRRHIFEEAAGISRYKSQKEESQKKLEQTEFNITRLKDIIAELERELKIKKSQSEKTKIFQELDEKRQIHDQKILLSTINEMEENLIKLQEKLEKKVHEREKSRQKILQLEEQIIIIDQEKQTFIDEMHQKDIHHQLSNEKIIQLEKSNAQNSQRRNEVNLELNIIKNHIENVNKRIQDFKAQLANQKQLYLELNHQLGDTEKTIKEITSNTNKLLDNIKSINEMQKKLQQESESQREHLKKLRREQEVIIQNLLEFLKREKEQWSKTLDEIESQKRDFKQELANFSTLISQSLEKIEIDPNESRKLLIQLNKDLKSSDWLSTVEKLSDLEKKFWNLLYEKGGIHSQKEDFDEQIQNTEDSLEKIENRISGLTLELEKNKEEISRLSSKRDAMLGDIRTFEVQKNNVNEKERNISDQIKNEENSLLYFSERYGTIENELLQLNEKEKNINREISTLKNSLLAEAAKIENFKSNIKRLDEKKDKIFDQVKKENNATKEQFDGANELEVKIGTLIGMKGSIQQDIYNNYNVNIQELREKFKSAKFDVKIEKEAHNEILRNIREIGAVNPLAIDELNTIQSLYDHNNEQLNDIINARKDILLVISQIQEKSEKIFMESFIKIGENFRIIFQKLFKGGDVSLKLTDETKPLESGIEIQAQPPGKRARSLRLLSGGEKALTAIALMFGVYMVKSSPFCVLDEIDAPLDDQNVGRFLTLLDDFREKTQFVLITHNKKTMSKADTLFGITMDEPGISRLLSVELKAG
ncbi:MAG: AAA family ATPase [Spirochaetia bacterium]|nr:AAA family ATPase [Spirochaetia bacterium]